MAGDIDHHRTKKKIIMEKALPEITYKEVIALETSHVSQGCCTVCLDEFEKMDKVRWLTGCRHVFHLRCIDRWIDSGHLTCPICRAPLFSGEVEEALKEGVTEANLEYYFVVSNSSLNSGYSIQVPSFYDS